MEAESPEADWYDRVEIMPEGADEGADLLLLRASQTVGVVQCKRYNQAIGVDQILLEIYKFLEFRMLAGLSTPSGFRYQLWTARAPTKEAIEFFRDPAKAIDALGTASRDDVAKRASKKAKALAALQLDRDKLDVLHDTFDGLSLLRVGPDSFARRLAERPATRRQFFRSPGDSDPSSAQLTAQLARVRLEHLQVAQRKLSSRTAVHVTQSRLDEAFDDFMAGPARGFVLTGGSGFGKSTWCTHLLSVTPPAYEATLLQVDRIGADDANFIETLARVLAARPDSAGMVEGSVRAIGQWLDSANRLILVDGLDRISTSARGRLAGWVQDSIRLCQQASAKIVLTSRPEIWPAIAQLFDPDVRDAIHSPSGDAPSLEAAPSFRLAPLSLSEARACYQAYGLPPAIHGYRPLNSPGLIAHWADLRDALPNGQVTRRILMGSIVQRANAEVHAKGHGRAVCDAFLQQFGKALSQSHDGRAHRSAISADLSVLAVVDAYLHTDLVAAHDDGFRAEPDEAAEFLGARTLDISTAIEDLRRRAGEPMFVGMVAMAIASLEDSRPDELRAVIEQLTAQRKRRPEFADLLARILADLSNQQPYIDAIRSLIESVAAGPGFLVSNAFDLIQDLKLPTHQSLEILLTLEQDEDPDDWRTKFWLDPEARGRIITPLASALSAAVQFDPPAALDYLALRRPTDQISGAVHRALVIEAGALAPAHALDLLWPIRTETVGAGFGDIARLHPDVAAQVILKHCEESSTLPADVAKLLRNLSQDHLATADVAAKANAEIATTARTLIERAKTASGETSLLLATAPAGLTSIEQSRLAELWQAIPDHEVWPLIDACPEHRSSLLDRLFNEAEKPEGHAEALRFLRISQSRDDNLVGRLVGRLVEASARATDDAMPLFADAIETLLYWDEERDVPLAEVQTLAREMAGSPNNLVRKFILYFAGSPIRGGDATPERLARREELMDRLVDAETGELLSVLVWKLGESAGQQVGALNRMVRLCRSLGVDVVEGHLTQAFLTTPDPSAFRSDLQSKLKREGLQPLSHETMTAWVPGGQSGRDASRRASLT